MAATLAQCQQLVAQMQAMFAQQVLTESQILKVIYREYQPQVIAAGSTATTINLTDDAGASLDGATAADLTDVTATVPVARLLADSNFFAMTMKQLARKLADVVDSNSLGAYAAFTANSTQGAPETNVTDAALQAAGTALDGQQIHSGQPRYLALHATVATAHPALQALASVVDQTKAGAGTVNSDYLANRVPKWRGFTVIPSRNVPKTGSGPAFTHNFAFVPRALGIATMQRALTNDPTHVQGYSASTDATFGVTVYLTYNSSNDAQAIGFGVREILSYVNKFGVQIYS